MKILTFCCSLLLFMASAVAQDPYSSFVKAFNQAAQFSDEKVLKKAMRTWPDAAERHYEVLCMEVRAGRLDPTSKAGMEILKKVFVAMFEVDTLDKVDKYYKEMTAEDLSTVAKLQAAFDLLLRHMHEGMTAKDRKRVVVLLEDAMGMARSFEEMEHPLRAAKTWDLIAGSFQNIPERTTADRREAMDAVRNFMGQRKVWNWTKDPRFLQWEAWLKNEEAVIAEAEAEEKKRVAAGIKADAKGLDKYLQPGASPIIVDTTFKELSKLADDCFFYGGKMPSMWQSVEVQNAPAKLANFSPAKLFLVRNAASKFGVSLNGDEADVKKNPGQKVKAVNQITSSIFYRDGKKGLPYAMFFYQGGAAEPFGSTVTSMESTKEYAKILFRSASSWTCQINGVQLTFYDDNCSGDFLETDPYALELKDYTLGSGVGEAVAVPAFDSMRVGKGPVQPCSSVVKIADQWFRLRSSDKGRKVVALPMHATLLRTGTVQLKWAGLKGGLKPEFLILQGKDDFYAAAFNVAGGKPVQLPAGEYEIAHGRLGKGKGAQALQVNVLKGDAKSIVVKAGENTQLTLGGKFFLDFKKGKDGDKESLDSLNFQVKSKSGEIYVRMRGPIPAPEVLSARDDSGKGAKVIGEYVAIDTADTLNMAIEAVNARKVPVLGVGVAMFPIIKGNRDHETIMELPKESFIGLRVKKNKLFGKLNPVFK